MDEIQKDKEVMELNDFDRWVLLMLRGHIDHLNTPDRLLFGELERGEG